MRDIGIIFLVFFGSMAFIYFLMLVCDKEDKNE